MFGKRLFALSLLLVMMTGLLFNVDMPARAQDDGGDDDEIEVVVEITGDIEFVDGDIVVGGVTVVAPAGGFNPSGLEDGDCVVVTGIVLPSDTLQAISLVPCAEEEPVDTDSDGILDDDDNCPTVANEDQADTDSDGVGDICEEEDTDEDGVLDGVDNCPQVANNDQADADEDGVGDLCEVDSDEDGFSDDDDNCPLDFNEDQADADHDGLGDVCDLESDTDGDGVTDAEDNCPALANADQADADEDGVGDACDTEDDDDGDDDGGDTTGGCDREGHPVLTVFADEFEIPYDELAEYRCEGYGIGEIGRALLMAEAVGDGTTYEDILALRADGQGWGAIKKQYDVSPSDLAPGRVVSGKHKKDTVGDDDEDTETDATVGGNPGQGGNPPGQDKKDQKQPKEPKEKKEKKPKKDNPGKGGSKK